jgi:hypothetical protein
MDMPANLNDQIVNRIAVRRVLCVGQAAVSQDVLVSDAFNAVQAHQLLLSGRGVILPRQVSENGTHVDIEHGGDLIERNAGRAELQRERAITLRGPAGVAGVAAARMGAVVSGAPKIAFDPDF